MTLTPEEIKELITISSIMYVIVSLSVVVGLFYLYRKAQKKCGVSQKGAPAFGVKLSEEECTCGKKMIKLKNSVQGYKFYCEDCTQFWLKVPMIKPVRKQGSWIRNCVICKTNTVQDKSQQEAHKIGYSCKKCLTLHYVTPTTYQLINMKYNG